LEILKSDLLDKNLKNALAKRIDAAN